MVDIDELERLLAAATGGPWRKGSRRNCDIDIIGKPSWPCKRFGKAGEWDVAVATELENAKEQQANAALIVAARNSLPAMLTEIRELRAENARLRKLTCATWFYMPDEGDHCWFSPHEVIDEMYDPEPGNHVFEVECATSLPSIWCAVRVTDDPDADERFTFTEHATEAEARAALGEPQ